MSSPCVKLKTLMGFPLGANDTLQSATACLDLAALSAISFSGFGQVLYPLTDKQLCSAENWAKWITLFGAY